MNAKITDTSWHDIPSTWEQAFSFSAEQDLKVLRIWNKRNGRLTYIDIPFYLVPGLVQYVLDSGLCPELAAQLKPTPK